MIYTKTIHHLFIFFAVSVSTPVIAQQEDIPVNNESWFLNPPTSAQVLNAEDIAYTDARNRIAKQRRLFAELNLALIEMRQISSFGINLEGLLSLDASNGAELQTFLEKFVSEESQDSDSQGNDGGPQQNSPGNNINPGQYLSQNPSPVNPFFDPNLYQDPMMQDGMYPPGHTGFVDTKNQEDEFEDEGYKSPVFMYVEPANSTHSGKVIYALGTEHYTLYRGVDDQDVQLFNIKENELNPGRFTIEYSFDGEVLTKEFPL